MSNTIGIILTVALVVDAAVNVLRFIGVERGLRMQERLFANDYANRVAQSAELLKSIEEAKG
jgi:hypothetical protein